MIFRMLGSSRRKKRNRKTLPVRGGLFVLYASLASVAFAVVFGILVSGLLVLCVLPFSADVLWLVCVAS